MATQTNKFTTIPACLMLFLAVPASAQEPSSPVVFRVEVVARSTKAINFHHRQGSTVMALEGSALAPKAKGEVRVDSKTGATKVEAVVEKMPPASSLAEGYLTYVLWAITPEGRAENLGEVMLDGDRARLQAATELQTFGIIVTAEPYYAVTQPSDTVVMEGVVKSGTTGTIMPIDARYELVARGGYLQQLPPGDRVTLRDARNNIPLDLMEARQAMAVARAAGGERHAGETLRKAAVDLGNAEAFLKSGQDRKKIQTLARHVTQLAEDARLIAVRRNNEEALAAERAAADQRANALTLTAEKETERRRQAEQEADRKSREALQAQNQAEQERIRSAQAREQSAAEIAAKERQLAEEAERSRKIAAEAEQVRAKQQALEAEMARARAAAEAAQEQAAARQRELEAQANKAKEAALAAEQKQQELEAEKARLRADLMRQLNLVLMTRETARGLIVNMSDVLFDIGRYSLKPGAREKLARISGIVSTHPGLRLEVEGHTDSTGGLALNQKLSEQRAFAVRDFLTAQGINAQNITARGFGPERPVADNATAAGRQANRRVELVVSGDAISPAAVSLR